MFDSDGNFLNAWARTGSGHGEFGEHQGIAVDASGRVYVTDSLNNRVQVFDSDGAFLTTFGTLGNGPGEFARPKGIAVDDASGRVYRTDGTQDTGTLATPSRRAISRPRWVVFRTSVVWAHSSAWLERIPDNYLGPTAVLTPEIPGVTGVSRPP